MSIGRRFAIVDVDGGFGGVRHQAVATGDQRTRGFGPASMSSARATAAIAEGRAMLAEFIATFALIFAGVGAIAVSTPLGGLQSLVGVALAHGLVLASMVTATAAISGGHVNPAVTLGALIAGQIKVWQAIGHVIAQVLGGIVGALLIGVCLPAGLLSRAGFGVPTPSAVTGAWTAVLIEFVLTFFLVFVVFGTAIDHRAPRVGGLFIGLTLVFGILVGGPLTGAALNPARFLGPSIAYATQLQDTWIYLLGPLAGGALAGLVWRFGFQVGQPAEA